MREKKLTMPRKIALDHDLVIIFLSRNKIIKPYILVKDCKESALHTHGFPLDYTGVSVCIHEFFSLFSLKYPTQSSSEVPGGRQERKMLT